eukprot:TRINITY_DN4831_c0_g1_i1.p1 TRINITY_DN4831_c0_g1~~TRINITY_DN4831_c0_g1_i1.p1  ORF type:complete len:275 (-),score=108.48 TRINITY_DN4831_c0_g1_i1:128-952(-)
MSRVAGLAGLAGCLVTADALSLSNIGLRQTFGANLRPDAAAAALAPVEDEWEQQVTMYTNCVAEQQADSKAEEAACEAAPQAFGRSCDTVVKAVVHGSSGDKEAVQNYLGEVCGQSTLAGWKQGYCQWFQATVTEAMSLNSYSNRESLKIGELCHTFWQRILKEGEAQRLHEKTVEKLPEVPDKAVEEPVLAAPTVPPVAEAAAPAAVVPKEKEAVPALPEALPAHLVSNSTNASVAVTEAHAVAPPAAEQVATATESKAAPKKADEPKKAEKK